MSPIRALEFFSGIGGLHFGFLASGAEGEVLASFDMNEHANATYEKSFGKKPVSRGIDKLKLKELEKYNANCWLMSPPCQPYTRGGKLLDDKDTRAKPLLCTLDLLEEMEDHQLPTYIFLENVKNFEISRSRDRMVRLLHKRGYVFRECLVAPFHFGVPNDRLRYFLMARLRSSFPGASATPAKAPNENDTPKFTFDPDREPIYTSWPFPAFVEDPSLTIKPYAFEMPRIENFLDGKEHEEANKAFLLTKKLIVERPNFRFDVLKPSSTRSSCFTKAYGSHHVKNGGGLLQTENMEQDQYDFADAESIARLGLRFFSPTEVARLHAFPLEETKENDEQESGKNKKEEVTVEGTKTTVRRFTLHATRNGKYALKFPETMTAIQRFRLLGNSLNVWVVAELLRGVLFAEHEGMPTDQQSCITDMEVLPKPNTNNNNKQERSSLDSGSDDDEKDEREPKRRREG